MTAPTGPMKFPIEPPFEAWLLNGTQLGRSAGEYEINASRNITHTPPRAMASTSWNAYGPSTGTRFALSGFAFFPADAVLREELFFTLLVFRVAINRGGVTKSDSNL